MVVLFFYPFRPPSPNDFDVDSGLGEEGEPKVGKTRAPFGERVEEGGLLGEPNNNNNKNNNNNSDNNINNNKKL